MSKSAFTNEKLKLLALANYQDILSTWPVLFAEHYIETTFGTTFVLAFGKTGAPPLVLLHGSGGNATMWQNLAEDLSKHFMVYAIDIIGEAGRSDFARPKILSKGYEHWLDEIVSQLGLTQFSLTGLSLGGYLAYRYAKLYPNKLKKLILLAPPSLARIHWRFIGFVVLTKLLPFDFVIRRFLFFMSTMAPKLDAILIQAFVNQFKAYRSNPDFINIPVLEDQEYLSLKVETLILLGDREVLYKSKSVKKHIEALKCDNITVQCFESTGHIITVDQPDKVIAALLD